MRVAVLGWPSVIGAGDRREVRGPRQVGLLALLATAPGEIVRRTRLEDELWDGERVSEAALRVTVRRLRQQFVEAGVIDPIRAEPSGYRLAIEPEQVDARIFERLVATAGTARTRGDARRAIEIASEADGIWRGPAFDGALELPSVRAEHERLERVRAEAIEAAATDLVLVGEPGRAAAMLQPVLDRHPFRESAWARYMIALHREGRPAEAVAAYERVRRILDTELGVCPSAEVEAVRDSIISGASTAEVGAPLLRSREARSRPAPRAGVAPAPTGPFVGRDKVVTDLRHRLEDVAGQTIVVEGPPGIGKTRIVEELSRELARAGWFVVGGSCHRDGGVGLEPIADLAQALLEVLPPHERTEFAVLATVAPGSFDGSIGAPVDRDVELQRLRIHDATRRLLDRTASRANTAVVVDDLHWIEAGGASMLARLVTGTAAAGVRWVLTARTADRTDAATNVLADLGRGGAQWIRVEPLTDEDSRELIARLGRGPVDDGWVDVIARRACGNPLLLTSLVRHVLAGGDAAQVPSTVAASVRATMATLPASAARLVEALAVANRPASAELLASVTQLDADELECGRRAATAAGLAEADETGAAIRLDHDLVAQAVIDDMDRVQRSRLHRRWAGVLLPRPGGEPLALEHLLDSGAADRDDLDAATGPAMRSLLAQGSLEVAARLAGRYLDAVGPTSATRAGVEARLQAATALLAAGEVDRGRTLLDTVMPLVRRLEDPLLLADALLARGPIDVAGAGSARTAEEADRLLALLPSDETARRVQVACWVAHHLANAGRTAGARRALRTADDDLGRHPAPGLRALFLGVGYQVATMADGAPRETRAAAEDLARFAELSGEISAETMRRLIGLDRACRDGSADELTAALQALDEIRSAFPRPDLAWWVAAGRAGLVLSAGGRDGQDAIARAEAVGRDIGLTAATPVAATQRVVAQWHYGRRGALQAVFERRAENTPTIWLLAGARVRLEAGDTTAAARAAAIAGGRRPLLPGCGNGWALAAALAGEVAERTGAMALAERVAEELTPHLGTGLSTGGLAHLGAADRPFGQALIALGDLDGAVEALERALETDRARGWSCWAAHAAGATAAARQARRRGDDTAFAELLRAEAARIGRFAAGV